MNIKAIITEKSLAAAKNGKYTFNVDSSLTKHEIKLLVEKMFKVHVIETRTIKNKSEVKRSRSGKLRATAESKKAIVTLKDKETIELFEVKN